MGGAVSWWGEEGMFEHIWSTASWMVELIVWDHFSWAMFAPFTWSCCSNTTAAICKSISHELLLNWIKLTSFNTVICLFCRIKPQFCNFIVALLSRGLISPRYENPGSGLKDLMGRCHALCTVLGNLRTSVTLLKNRSLLALVTTRMWTPVSDRKVQHMTHQTHQNFIWSLYYCIRGAHEKMTTGKG